MISPRAARFVASVHKWLGLIVGAQLVVWTCTGLFFSLFKLPDVRGENLVHPIAHQKVDFSKAKLTAADALKRVSEDRPQMLALKPLGGAPVYEIRGDIGVFLISAEDGGVMSPVEEDLAKRIAAASWMGPGKLASVELLAKAPHESGMSGRVWAAHFGGDGHPVLYINAVNGDLGPARTDLWRLYDFFYGLHVMDYTDHENAHQPWTMAAAAFAISTVLFGVVLLVHRFTRGLVRPKAGAA